MKSRIKIWLHSGDSSRIKEISLRKSFLLCSMFLFLSCVGIVSYFGYDYYLLKRTERDNGVLFETITAQKTELEDQRRQIQMFAGEIQGLKEQITKLGQLENQVRLIADIDKSGRSSGFLGIGGVSKTDLDQEIPLNTHHNALIREMHHQVKQIKSVADKEKLDFNDLIDQLTKKKNLLASSPSIKPVSGVITSPFGYRRSPFTGRRSFHSGLDISNRIGTKIVSTATGKVVFAGRKTGYGKVVVIDHGYGKATKYAHLRDILVHKSQQVKRGEAIATLGNTGRTTGPHLHYEVLVNGTPVNPSKYILN
ncbi:M23 family peptidase [Desulfobacter hydrogenophilus]|uniref:M23 family peptidase n=1 Tax=Desulfobacter hydrogenophilus TaxID=2291 RepID=A0A328FI43_9BACT|nr:peptidoglycan DD-metalloendopeptidase family protein [Desulfobacter hydrogenophilus]QBH11595.1 M23 family peptidase [Desulfobacter hydrogenophilus]RAM03142.1 M23 family peptidase [Desulfobacter hydrogenophilus]